MIFCATTSYLKYCSIFNVYFCIMFCTINYCCYSLDIEYSRIIAELERQQFCPIRRDPISFLMWGSAAIIFGSHRPPDCHSYFGFLQLYLYLVSCHNCYVILCVLDGKIASTIIYNDLPNISNAFYGVGQCKGSAYIFLCYLRWSLVEL